ncbi:MAG: hypothetical protein ABJA34_04205 [Pseudonocardiales bacterium]
MTRVDVDPAGYDAASKVFGQTIADELFHSFADLDGVLCGCSAMAGTDPGGMKWGSAYDEAMVTVVGVTEDVIDGVYKLADLLSTTGFNHGRANSASTPGGGAVTTAQTSYGENSVSLSTPPAAAGGSGSAPSGWGLISDLVGYVWPDGHQDKLRAAGGAWSTAATSVAGAGYLVPTAVSVIAVQHSPEVPDATTACKAMGTHIDELSTAYTGLGTACNDYAQHLDDAHHQIIEEVKSLVEWTAGLEIAGGVFAFFTAGLSEAAANLALAARCAAVAARVGTIIARLIELAGQVARSIVAAAARVIKISQDLKALLATRLSKITGAAVARLPKVGKTAEKIATGRLEKAAAEVGTTVARSELSESQLSNLSRFVKKLPAGAEDPVITRGADGAVEYAATVPGRVPGSSATYTKLVDRNGVTTSYYKTTVAPDGTVVHVKIKFP